MLWFASMKRFVFWVASAAGCWVIIGAQDATISCGNLADGDEFLFFKTELTFSSALDFCSSFGPGITLARVGNAATADVLRRDNNFEPDFWVGIFDKFLIGGSDNTARFSFVDGTTEELPFIQGTPGDDPWSNGQPNDEGGIEDCVIFIEDNGKIDDKPCTDLRPFACRRICPSEVLVTNAPTQDLNGDNILGQALFGAGFLLIFAVIVIALVMVIQERRAVAEIKLIMNDDIPEPSQKIESPEEHEVILKRVVEIDVSASIDSPRFSVQSSPEHLSVVDI